MVGRADGPERADNGDSEDRTTRAGGAGRAGARQGRVRGQPVLYQQGARRAARGAAAV